MLSTGLSTVWLAVLTVILALVVILVVRLANFVNTVLLPEARKSDVAALSAEMSDLRDAYESMLASHKKLRSRVGMRDLRDRRKNGEDTQEPDWRTDPAAYKRQMRLKHLKR